MQVINSPKENDDKCLFSNIFEKNSKKLLLENCFGKLFLKTIINYFQGKKTVFKNLNMKNYFLVYTYIQYKSY